MAGGLFHLGANRDRRVTCRGFSLIEVVIALAMLGALLASIFTFMTNLMGARDTARGFAGRQLAATTLIERLENDLFTCMVGDSRHGAGVRGDAQSIRILSRGIAAHLAADAAQHNLVFGDLQETFIRFDEQGGLLEGRRSALSPIAGSSPQGETDRIGALGIVRFRYHDGRGWRDSFDSLAAGRLPAAVEVAVWFINPQSPGARFDHADDPYAYLDDDDDWPADPMSAISDDDWGQFDGTPLPPPDRIRVIAIPDPDPADAALTTSEPMEDYFE